MLDRTLCLFIGARGGETNSISSNMLKGNTRLIVAFTDTLWDNLFKEKVVAYSTREIGQTAKEHKAGSLGFAEAMLIAYNRKMNDGLKWA